jgi:penicillin-binding protein 1A
MALKITCPSCGRVHALGEPLPLPGSNRQCACGQVMAINYPQRVVEQLKRRGATFERRATVEAKPFEAPPLDLIDGPAPRTAGGAPSADERPTELAPPAPAPGPGLDDFQDWEPTQIDPLRRAAPPDPPEPGPPPTAPPAPPRPPAQPPAPVPTRPAAAPPQPAVAPPQPAVAPPQPPPPRRMQPARPEAAPREAAPAPRRAAPTPPVKPPPKQRKAPPSVKKPKRSFLGRLVRFAVVLCLLGCLAGVGVVGGAILFFRRDLPTLETLQDYRPPTVTVVYDRDGELMGEIYEKRRYVVELDEIPQHVQDAFVASEDANFWSHAGVDPMGIVRAVLRNALKGKKAQGASTITQQVARNFLLSSEKKYSRKIKEMILATRVERAFSKEHILYLYLNQIYLGSGAYGVEAASRTYFDKHVQDITLAEAALLAGLPQRPSDYSPHNHWEKARTRQLYVLGQLLDKNFIDRATYDAAVAERIPIYQQGNPFLEQAPYYTEHVRRYLVETYGFDKIYNDGLIVHTPCDLQLQKVAQKAVINGVHRADHRIGWRGASETLPPGKIEAALAEQEQALREAISRSTLHVGATDSPESGYGAMPERSILELGERYPAVVLEVERRHAVVGIGAHRALIPLSWTTWAERVGERGFKVRRDVTDLNDVFAVGDRIEVTIEALDAFADKPFAGYDEAGPGPFLAARLYQPPEVQSAFLSYSLRDGGVHAMVGGYDFENSEYNRSIQARRQVGSTFKPIVYAAAIASEEFTVGSMVQDAPLIYNVLDEKLWKPANFGDDYKGNITLRRALQSSRNVCTVRVLDRIGLEAVYELAGPTLGIGYDTPVCERRHVPEGSECKGDLTPSTVEGMAWCEWCDPESCPLIKPKDGWECLDEPSEIDGQPYCHSCDVNLRVCDWLPPEKMQAGEECRDQRYDPKEGVLCRSCDLSMGLGSSSLTMVELMRAYSAFGTYGKLVEPHYIDKVVERDGTVIESYTPPAEWPQVMDPTVAGIANYLVRSVATGGTAAASNSLGLHVAGKTGTTNDFHDTWFVGYNTELIAASWVGHDQPRTLGYSFTGSSMSVPVWMEFMEAAAPKEDDKPFPAIPGVVHVPIDESTGRVASGGILMPMIPGTEPEGSTDIEVGQKTAEDLLTTDF